MRACLMRNIGPPTLALAFAPFLVITGQPEPSFHITFEAPHEVDTGPGAPSTVEARVLLHTRGIPPGSDGARGWTLFVKSTGCETVGATTSGTVAARVDEDPPGLRAMESFERSEVTCTCPQGFNGAITAVALDLHGAVTLDPADSPSPIFSLSLEGTLLPDGSCAECVIELVAVDLCNTCHTGELVVNSVSFRGEGYAPTHTPKTIRFCRARFHRSDSTGDGQLDTSDAATLLDYLFWGTESPECREAADSNNDGVLDISDGIYLLNFLFRGGPRPPSPGPPSEPCAPDPLDPPGYLGCDNYRGC